MRPYINTLFDTPTFKALMASDPKGVRAEAKARGPESKLARKVKAARKAAPAPVKVTRTVTPKVTARKGTPGGNPRTRAANASGHAPGSPAWWTTYHAAKVSA